MSRGAVVAAAGLMSRPYFPMADWYWNPIPASPVLDSNSAAIVTALSAAGTAHSLGIDKFAAKLVHKNEVTASTPRYTITFRNATGGASGENWGPSPFTGYTMPIPNGTENLIPPGDASWVDGHVSVADAITNMVFNVWQATTAAGPPRTWGASWGGRTPFYGDGRENPAIGISTGSGLSRYGGPVREAEFAAGVIEHALFFGTDMATLRGSNVLNTNYRFPATTTDGSNGIGSATTIMEGTRVQLDPSVNLSAISGITQVELIVGRALQKYGAYCGDNGGARMGFVAERVPGSTTYSNLGIYDYYEFSKIPWNQLRVLRQWDGR